MEMPEINNRIEEIANDKTSGASHIAKKAAECLDVFAQEIIVNKSGISIEQYLEELIKLAKVLVRSQPTMASVFRTVNDIILTTNAQSTQLAEELGPNKSKQLKYLCTVTQSAARKYVLESELALATLSRAYSEVLQDDDTIMTISASSAVEAIFRQASDDSVNFSLFVPESRPMYEGQMMAQRLAEHGVETTLIADSAMFHYLKDCTSIIVGADRVMPTGVMNKIGTYGLALAAKELKIPLYCICERTKFIPNILPVDKLIAHHPEDQVFEPPEGQKKPEKLSIKNIYFDFTPIKYVTNFLTEDGMMTYKQVIKYINGLEIMAELVASFETKQEMEKI